MKTSFPKARIRAVLLEGVHDAGAEMLTAEGFTVKVLHLDEVAEPPA